MSEILADARISDIFLYFGFDNGYLLNRFYGHTGLYGHKQTYYKLFISSIVSPVAAAICSSESTPIAFNFRAVSRFSSARPSARRSARPFFSAVCNVLV